MSNDHRAASHIEDLLAGQMRSRSLIVAYRLGLFRQLGERALSAAQLAIELGIVNVPGLVKLLANLEGIRLVVRVDGCYELTELARQGLLPESDSFYGEFIDFFADQFECKPTDDIQNHLRTGGFLRPAPSTLHWQHYMAAMDRMASLSANQIASSMRLENDRTLLDLGGGGGCYSIAACRAYSELNVTILDLPDTLKFAGHNVDAAGLASRISLLPGSVVDFQYGGPYDVVFLSHTIHLFDEATVQRVFSACYAALKPSGRLIVRDLFTDESRCEPLLGSLIALHMWNEGDAYSIPQVTALLRDAGFHSSSHIDFRSKGDPLILGSLMVAGKAAVDS